MRTNRGRCSAEPDLLGLIDQPDLLRHRRRKAASLFLANARLGRTRKRRRATPRIPMEKLPGAGVLWRAWCPLAIWRSRMPCREAGRVCKSCESASLYYRILSKSNEFNLIYSPRFAQE